MDIADETESPRRATIFLGVNPGWVTTEAKLAPQRLRHLVSATVGVGDRLAMSADDQAHQFAAAS